LAGSATGGRIGRAVRLPPQFGQTPHRTVSTQPLQKVHSNEQIIASADSGGRSLSQHSQFGRKSSIVSVLGAARARSLYPCSQ
jgi:hypothetical protein